MPRPSVAHSAAVIVTAMCSAAAGIAGCEDTSRMFTGRWVAETELREDWLGGWPELAIGHFGPELTGVAYRFLDEFRVSPAVYPCSLITHGSLDLETSTFVMSTAFGEELQVWSLVREVDRNPSEQRLVGSVSTPDRNRTQPVRLTLFDSFVPSERRVCDP